MAIDKYLISQDKKNWKIRYYKPISWSFSAFWARYSHSGIKFEFFDEF